MARDPGSVWAPLPEAGAPDGYVKTQFIVHSTGDNGTAAATRRYFAGATLNESTFIIGQGPWDPTLQIMDSTDVADANGSANARGISVEVAGDGIGGYNAWQRSELIRLGLWARSAHPGILPRQCPSHTEAGYGWHVMFGAPGPWAKGAKICPGPVRIRELQNDIFPAIFAGQTPVEDFLMALNDTEARLVLDWLRGKDKNVDALTALGIGLSNVRGDIARLAAMVATQNADVDEKALADQIIAGLAPQVVAAVGQQAGLSEERIAELTEQLVRGVFADAAAG